MTWKAIRPSAPQALHHFSLPLLYLKSPTPPAVAPKSSTLDPHPTTPLKSSAVHRRPLSRHSARRFPEAALLAKPQAESWAGMLQRSWWPRQQGWCWWWSYSTYRYLWPKLIASISLVFSYSPQSHFLQAVCLYRSDDSRAHHLCVVWYNYGYHCRHFMGSRTIRRNGCGGSRSTEQNGAGAQCHSMTVSVCGYRVQILQHSLC